MYKEAIISIVIILAVLVSNIISQNHTDETIEKFDASLYKLKKEIIIKIENTQENNEDVIREQIEKIYNDWESDYYVLAIYIEHDELEKVKKELVELKANIEVEAYKEAIVSLDSSIFSLEHLKEKEVFNLDNFF